MDLVSSVLPSPLAPWRLTSDTVSTEGSFARPVCVASHAIAAVFVKVRRREFMSFSKRKALQYLLRDCWGTTNTAPFRSRLGLGMFLCTSRAREGAVAWSSYMTLSRREWIGVTFGGLAFAQGPAATPWYQNMRRCGQV